MPITLVTGTSSGIGLEIAVQAAVAGHTVIATMRNLERAGGLKDAADAAGVSLDIRRLDVTDSASIGECIAGVVADHGALDALVNNAGAGHVGTLEQEPLEAVREVMEVDFYGTIAPTKAALPHLRASRGRLVSVTSVGGVVGQPFNEAYCAAKFAVEGFMESLAPVLALEGVRVTVVEPGAVASEFVNNIDIDREAAGDYVPALEAYLARTAGAFSNAQSAHDAAAAVVAVLESEAPAFRVQTSEGATAFAGLKLADLDGARVQTMTGAWVASEA